MLLRIAELEAQAATVIIEADRLSDGQAAEIEALEARLRERGVHVAELSRELRRQEKLGLELVSLLEEGEAGKDTPPGGGAPPPSSNGAGGPSQHDEALREKLDRMALDAARREGELHARAWRISELEQELMRASEASALEPLPRARVSHIEDELDMLRRALAQSTKRASTPNWRGARQSTPSSSGKPC